MAYGACVQAAVLSRKPSAPSMYVRNVIPLTIGIIGSKFAPVFRRNTPIPIEKVVHGRTVKDEQTRAVIRFAEGKNGSTVLGEMIVNELTLPPLG